MPTNRFAVVVRLIPQSSFRAELRAHPERETAAQAGAPYAISRYFLMTSEHVPCNAPPWGVLTAIDAGTGERRWESPLSSLGLGGPIVTGGGLVFLSATVDPHLRAFDVVTGKELWAAELPVAARATPMTYQTRPGKQFVVVSAGGLKGITPTGDYVVAYSLP